MVEQRNIYKGHRYVPKIMGEWNQSESYEGLSIVTNEGNSYTSKKRVPIGIDISNEEYWVVTGNYNAQIEHYREDVLSNTENVIQYKTESTALIAGLDKDVNDRGINVQSPPKPFTSAKGDGVTDDTFAIQQLADNFNNLYFPNGEYLISNTLKIRPSNEWVGQSWMGATLKYVGTGDLIYADGNILIDDVQHSLTYGLLYNLRLKGNGVSNNQTGLNLQSYMGKLDRLQIEGFSTGVKAGGVYVELIDCYIQNNKDGVIITKNTGHESGLSTMLRFRDCKFIQNTGIGLTNYQEGKGNKFLNAEIDGCGFELNNQGMKITDYDTLILQSNWFESNTVPNLIQQLGTVLLNNRFNDPSETFDYYKYGTGIWPYGAGGYSSVDDTGNANFKKYRFQRYNNDTLTNDGILELGENAKNDHHYIEQSDGVNKLAVQTVNSNKTFVYNKEYHIFINGDSELVHDFETDLVLTKVSTGVYEIKFPTGYSHPIINANAVPDVQSNSGMSVVCGLYAKFIDPGTFQESATIDTLRITCVDINNANTPVNSKVMITVKPRFI